jgi:hypothetical protein
MSLDAKLLRASAQRGVDVNRLRRHLVFQRLLRRLAVDSRWVVKGGYVLESRIGWVSRATRDLDLSSVVALDTPALLQALEDALGVDVDGDGFFFTVAGSRPHLIMAQGPGLHVAVTADLAGRPFAAVRLDVVSRPDELGGAFEPLALPEVVGGLPWPAVVVATVNPAQHIAEKLHALATVNAHPRPSTRVKDLLDIALILHLLHPDEAEASRRLRAVFHTRNQSEPPPGLPQPPAAWRGDYTAMAAELGGVRLPGYDDALALARALYARLTGG